MDGALEAADATPRRTTFDKIFFLLQMQIEILKISFNSTRRKFVTAIARYDEIILNANYKLF